VGLFEKRAVNILENTIDLLGSSGSGKSLIQGPEFVGHVLASAGNLGKRPMGSITAKGGADSGEGDRQEKQGGIKPGQVSRIAMVRPDQMEDRSANSCCERELPRDLEPSIHGSAPACHATMIFNLILDPGSSAEGRGNARVGRRWTGKPIAFCPDFFERSQRPLPPEEWVSVNGRYGTLRHGSTTQHGEDLGPDSLRQIPILNPRLPGAAAMRHDNGAKDGHEAQQFDERCDNPGRGSDETKCDGRHGGREEKPDKQARGMLPLPSDSGKGGRANKVEEVPVAK
jgi:hypothetical protein